KGQIPSDVHVAAYYDQSLLVRDSISSVRDAIIIGLLLSVVILYAFLRNWGTTFVAILVIPVTILVTFLAMWLAHLSFDLMTLGGVAAAIGLVIDDAIVVVENIYTHVSRGRSLRVTNGFCRRHSVAAGLWWRLSRPCCWVRMCSTAGSALSFCRNLTRVRLCSITGRRPVRL